MPMRQMSTPQRKTLLKLLKEQPPADAKIHNFLVQYFHLEGLLQTIGRYYRSRNGLGLIVSDHEALNIAVVSRSLKCYGAIVPELILESLLDSRLTRRGHRSARNLRNAIVHRWQREDRLEVMERSRALDDLFKSVIAAIDSVLGRK